MKKLAIFAAAFVLTLGLAQCKKEQPATPQDTDANLVHITVNVGNGSRADVNNGHITFNDGDKLYVGYGGVKVNGELTYSSSTNKFSGSLGLTEVAMAQKLHFYYLGGRAATQGSEPQQYTVDIIDQTSDYPVISYGTSTEDYSANESSYTTTLFNQCALVEFTTNEIPMETAVTISGMKNKVTVDFSSNTLTPSLEGTGSITLHAESSTSRWAILLPNDDEVTTTATAEGYYESDDFTVPSVAINDYLTGNNGANLELYTPLTMPLTLEAIADGNISFYNNAIKPVTYRIDGGEPQSIGAEGFVNIPVVAGQKVAFYGNSNRYSGSNIGCSSVCYVYGNVMSLTSPTDFATLTELLGEGSFANLFESNTNIINHPSKTLVLPATTLKTECYKSMFYGCTGLTTAPELPAETLTRECYLSMFYNCSNLNSVTCLATNISASSCTENWLYGVAASGTFNRNESMNNWQLNSASGIPSGWTVVPPVVTIIDLSTVTSNTTVGDGAILTGTLGHDVQISIAAGATVTLKGANINNNSKRESSNCAGITCLGNATINLYGGFINNINSSSDDYPGIQAGPSETTLTIQGTGSLNVQGGSYAAGIGGGGYGFYCGNISLMGGTISACGGQNGAGIGSGIYGSCGNIYIHGDEITAQGGNGAAGIGSGKGGSCGNISIEGGSVTANGGNGAAGIGSGEGGSCGNISIEGGSVTANGGYGAAGIGCGRYGGSCGNINIVGGNITACGGEGAQNIGTGDYSGDCGTITVPLPEGALSGLFSVSRFKQVRFSQGNLLSDGTFADNQYTYGDHFGSNSNYGPTNDWYALSADEWNYLFENSTFGFGTVNGIHGLIILPDNYTGTSIKPYMSNYIYATLPWDDNTYSGDAWTTMENNGVVFLPAAGYYSSGNLQHQSEQGRYWSSSFNQSLLFKGQNGSTYMRSVEVGEHALGLQMSVRLVRTN